MRAGWRDLRAEQRVSRAARVSHGALRQRMRVSEIHNNDLPEAYVRLLYSLPDDTPVASRIDRLVPCKHVEEGVAP